MTAAARKMPLPVSRRERGLTMMELLVTVAILSLLMAGLSQLVVTNSQNANATGALARIADTGRTAIQLLSADIRRAGYLGGYVDSLSMPGSDTGTLGVSNNAVQCIEGTTNWARMLDQPIMGLNDTDADYACIADADPDAPGKYLRGDLLTVRYTPTPPVEVGDMVATRPYIRVTMDERWLFFGIDASDASNLPVFSPPPPVRDYNLAAHTYFVGATRRTCQGREIPALFRKTIGNDGLPETQELLAGVENLQLRYLADNRYYDADEVPLLAPGEWQRVDAVEITVLVRAECPETGFDINRTFALADVEYTPGNVDFRRQVFTTTTQLRN